MPKVAIITKFFSVISKEEQLAQWQRSQTQLGERLKEQAARREQAKKARLAAKCPVGRPKKSTAVPSTILIPVQASGQQPIAQNGGEQGDAIAVEETGVDASEKPPPAKKKRGSYTNRFILDLWPFIEQAVKQHPKSLYEALFSLQHIRKPGQVDIPFDNLTISTLKGWFEKDVTGRFVLRRKYEEAIKLQSARSAAQDKGPRGILKDHPVAFQMIVDTLKACETRGSLWTTPFYRQSFKGLSQMLPLSSLRDAQRVDSSMCREGLQGSLCADTWVGLGEGVPQQRVSSPLIGNPKVMIWPT